MLSNSAFNALLKILEEPPEHLIFILATTELHKVPSTILSRCQRYSFRRIPPEIIVRRLLKVAEAEGIGLTDEAALLLARLADGSLRDALSLLDQCAADTVDTERVLSAIGLAENDEICALMKELLLGDAEAAIVRLNALYMSGKDVASTLNQLASLYRDLLLLRMAPNSGGSLMSGAFSDSALSELGRLVDTPGLLAGLNELQEAAQRLARSGDRKLAAELCLLKLSTSGTAAAAEEENAAPRKPKKERERAARPPVEPGEGPAGENSLIEAENIGNEAERKTGPAAAEEKKTSGSGKAPEWKSLLGALKGRLTDKEFEIISDPQHAEVELSRGSIKILALNYYSQGFLSNPQLLAAVKEAASALAGGTVTFSWI
jgi:DNA polymerase-3 subunit gamma/tau